MSTTEATNDSGALNKQKIYAPPGGGVAFGSALPHAISSDFQPPARVRSTPPSLAEQSSLRPGYFPQKSNMRAPQRNFIYPPQASSYPNVRYPIATSPSMMVQPQAVHPASPTDASRGLPRGRPPSPSIPTGGGGGGGGGGDTTPRGGRGNGRGGRMVRVSSAGRLARNEMEPQSPSAAGMPEALMSGPPRGVNVYTAGPGQNILQSRPPPPYMVNTMPQPYPPMSLQPQQFQQISQPPQHRQPMPQHMLHPMPMPQMLSPMPGQMSPGMHPIQVHQQMQPLAHQQMQSHPQQHPQQMHHLSFSPTLHPNHGMQPPLAHLGTPTHMSQPMDAPMQLAPPHKQPVFYTQPHFAGSKPALTLGPSAATNAAAVAAASNLPLGGVISTPGPSKALLIIDPDTGKDIFSAEGHQSVPVSSLPPSAITSSPLPPSSALPLPPPSAASSLSGSSTLLASSPEFEMSDDSREKRYERRLEILTPPHSPALSPSIASPAISPSFPSQAKQPAPPQHVEPLLPFTTTATAHVPATTATAHVSTTTATAPAPTAIAATTASSTTTTAATISGATATAKTPAREARDSVAEPSSANSTSVSPAPSVSPRSEAPEKTNEETRDVTLHIPSSTSATDTAAAATGTAAPAASEQQQSQAETRPEESSGAQKRKKDKFEHLKGVVLPPTSGSAPAPFLEPPSITIDNSSADDESAQEEPLQDMAETPDVSDIDDLTDEDLDVPEPTENGMKDPSCLRYVYPPGFLLNKRHLFTLPPTEGKMHKDITKDADDTTALPAEQWQRGRSVPTPRAGASGRAVRSLPSAQPGGLSLRKKMGEGTPQWGTQSRQTPRPAARPERGAKSFGNRRNEASTPMNIFVKPLEKTESRWERGTPITDETDKILRRIRLILNKLSLDKLTVLAEQAIELLKSSVDRASLLREVIVVIFDKALSEKYFAGMYSKLCVKLSAALPKLDEKVEKDGVVTTQKTSFRRILLNKCQEEFERGTEKLDATASNIEKLRQQKARMLGNITFIGELYKSNMIGERIMHECVDHLMHDEESEEDLHALCDFLTTIGQKLDQPLAAERMNVYFKQLEKLSNSKTLPSRSRFMCMDLIELRANKWIPRRKKNEAMTREEVHKESVKESSQKTTGDVRIKKKPETTLRPALPTPTARPVTKDRFALQTDLPKAPEPSKEREREKSEHRDKDRDHRRDRSKERDRDRDSRRSSRDRDRDGERSRGESRERSRGDDRKESRRTSSSSSSSDVHRSSDRSRDRRSHERDHSREKDKEKYSSRERGEKSSRESRHRDGSKSRRHRDGSKSKHSDRKSSSDEEAVKKMSSALKEFGEAQDFNEVVQCVKELKSSKHWLVVRVALQQSMDPSAPTRDRNTQLLVRLCQSGSLSVSDFEEGIRAFLPLLDEVVEDCPHAAKWAAEMIAQWVSARCASLRFLNISSQSDAISDHLEKLVGYLLQTLLNLVGVDVLKKEYQDASVQETSFLRQPLPDFINTYKLSPLFP